MLYKFKGKNTGDVIMLEPQGRRILEIIGKDSSPKGIILPGDMPAAIEALRNAIAEEERDAADQKNSAQEGDAKPGKGDGVSLRQRAQPFIEMLQRSHQHGDEIVWGV